MNFLKAALNKIRDLVRIPVFKIILFLIVGVVIHMMMYGNVKPEKLDFSMFAVSEQTVRSPITIEDRTSTEKKRQEAVDQVQDVYRVKGEYATNRVDLITSIFQTVEEVNEEVKKIEESAKPEDEESSNKDKDKDKKAEVSDQEKLTMAKAELTDAITKEVSDNVLLAILRAPKADVAIMKDLTITAINNSMRLRISAEEVENAKKRVEEELKYAALNQNLKDAAVELGRFAIVQNEFYDSVATEELRQQASESVEPVKILQGQVIVEEGQLISKEIYNQLELVGLQDNRNSYLPFLGLTMLIALILGTIYFYFSKISPSQFEKNEKTTLIFLIVLLLSIGIMKIISLFQEFEYSEVVYIFPAAMGTMIIKILIDEKPAIILAIVSAITGSIIFNGGVSATFHVSVGIYILFSSLAGILFLRSSNQRSQILQAGAFVSAINVVTVLALIFVRNGQYSGFELGVVIGAAFTSGIAASVLAIGILPFLEASFGILSTMKLIELSNPNHPLLRRLLVEAPGTYHHSVMVANLSETACEAIGANGLLARVGCYYHDIGKVKRPHYFIENQVNIPNPHDNISPRASSDIIIAHATDGAEMLRKYRMPKEIIDVAEQHHGTSLLKFFYHKVQESDEEVNEADFRYPGPKAQTKELAIIGIADSVEAATRSLKNPTPEAIENLVENMIKDRLQDGQFNECDITLKELEIVRESLCETLKGTFHSRIEYPDTPTEKRE